MKAGAGTRSSSRSTAGSTPGEEPDNSGVDTTPTSTAMLQQKGRQGAGLVRDMYKMFDGSALVALGRHPSPPVNALLAADCGVQEFSCTSISNGLFDETGAPKGIPSGSWKTVTKGTKMTDTVPLPTRPVSSKLRVMSRSFSNELKT